MDSTVVEAYDTVLALSEDYQYDNRREAIKVQLKSKLEFVKVKADEFKQLSGFRFNYNDYSHGIKNQSAYDI